MKEETNAVIELQLNRNIKQKLKKTEFYVFMRIRRRMQIADLEKNQRF